jgi:hypothetical protein
MSDAASPSASDVALLRRQLRTLRWTALGALVVGGAALALAALVLLRAPASAATTAAGPARFDELTVGRLNIIEPDGTPRMIIASRAKFPGVPIRGKEVAHPNRSDVAGILFVDDEGTENGGLVQTGQLDPTGKVAAALSLTFDRFRQDQVVQLMLDEDGDDVTGGLVLNDLPSYKVFSIEDALRLSTQISGMSKAEQEAIWKQQKAMGHTSRRRGYLGIRKGVSQLVLHDPQGRPRLTLAVSETGEPSLVLLDETGHTVRSIDAHTP